MEIGIYIHIPFCKSKCYYCDYPSYANMESIYKTYVDALMEEIKAYKQIIGGKYKVKTISIGGGTPSVLPSILLEKLLKCINDSFNFSNNIEFTVEVNPETLTKKKAYIMKGHRVNRISLGVQAFQDSLLGLVGRNHKESHIINSYKILRKAGFDNINMDLIFGIPEQSKNQWKETLAKAVSFEPDHISTYNLLDEGIDLEMYSYAKKYLSKKGYDQYDISNYAKKGKESIHLIDGWRLKEYIGLGLSSHSYFKDYRFNNTHNIEEYLLNSSNLKLIQKNKEPIRGKTKIEEYMFLGLGLNKGINIKDFKEEFGKSIFEIYEKEIKENIESKLLLAEGDNIFLSDLGRNLSNRVFLSFLID